MAHPSKRKGSRIEQELVRRHKAAGIEASRVPLSGAAGGPYSGDLRIAGGLVAEVKARAGGNGFRTLERWLGEKDLLFLRRDYAEPLVLMPWAVYEKLMQNQFPAFDMPDFADLEFPELEDFDWLDFGDLDQLELPELDDLTKRRTSQA